MMYRSIVKLLILDVFPKITEHGNIDCRTSPRKTAVSLVLHGRLEKNAKENRLRVVVTGSRRKKTKSFKSNAIILKLLKVITKNY